MAAFLLDTTVLIDVLRGRPGALRRLGALRKAHDSVFACAINVEEVARGLRPAEDEAATRLFEGLRIAPLGRREGWSAGEWRRALASRGRTVAQADALVAAAAHSLSATLATGNLKDFPTAQPPLDGLRVEDWPSGE